MYEWLPYTFDVLEEVPEGEDARREWLGGDMMAHPEANTPVDVSDRFRETLDDQYGDEPTRAVTHGGSRNIGGRESP